MDKIKILKVEPGKPPCVKEIANDFKASQVEAVSYTHLDVYKRQVLYGRAGDQSHCRICRHGFPDADKRRVQAVIRANRICDF